MSGSMLLAVEWPAPANVSTFSTTRCGGVSSPPYDSLNLSASSGDDAARVARNAERLRAAAGLPCTPRWPRQVHGATVVDAAALEGDAPHADAVLATRPGLVCSVRTADCLPVLLCNRDGTAVAAAHAGWRGLASGVLEACVAAMPSPPGTLLAWLGPAIGPRVYEVGDEVRDAFMAAEAGAAAAFAPSPRGRWLADLYALAGRRLRAAGVTAIHGGGLCTFSEPQRFFSYRRDATTGRMASGIWIKSEA